MATVSTDNTIKSWIEQRRNVLSHAAKGPWRTGGWGALLSADNEQLLAGTATSEGYVQDEADERAIVDAHNMFPRALDALSKVLERHQPIDGLAYDSPPQECNVCADDRGPRPWPCPTVQAIEGAINHE